MIARTNLYAVVVWYHPTPEHCASVRSYADAVQHVVIVDNSDEDNTALAQTLPEGSYTYLPLHANLGIATALNTGCRWAVEHGAEWMLTMDQDSRWEPDQLALYIRLANDYPDLRSVGIFSPRQDYTGRMPRYANAYEEKIAVMTSGCIMSAEGFRATGGFRDELFIDEVDNEYCMHCRRLGLKVVIVNHARLEHRLGEQRTVRLLGIWKKEYIDHAPFRFYYMTRNILCLNTLYPEYRRFNNKRLKKMLKRVILYDNLHKLTTLRMCLRGWRDFRAGRMGAMGGTLPHEQH